MHEEMERTRKGRVAANEKNREGGRIIVRMNNTGYTNLFLRFGLAAQHAMLHPILTCIYF